VDSRLLERSDHLASLRAAYEVASRGPGGAVVLVGGEAGAGKTALLREFRRLLPGRARVLWGSCDPLFTPRPLGPFVDIAQKVGGEFARLVESGAKAYQVAASLMGEAGRGMAVVLEDLHWADEATLDVVSLLGRRIDEIPMLLVASYRDDELGRAHPLRILLGELRGGGSIRRLTVEPLSLNAVSALAEQCDLDAASLHRITAGNPFFVAEVIASRSGEIPPTVRDAVMARAGRLPEAARTVLDAAAIALPQAEMWLLDALGAQVADGLEQCLATGILEATPEGVAFRHELARMAVAESLSPHRRTALHHMALRALADSGSADVARLAHHADAAGQTDAVLAYAPAAARAAAAAGAHIEAAAQYARALRYGDGLSLDDRASLLEARSYECYLTDQTDAAIETLEHAIELRRAGGDQRQLGSALSQLSRRLWCGGRPQDARQAGREAMRLLEGLPDSRELALAYSNLALLNVNDERTDETIVWGGRALTVAEAVGDMDVVVHSLNNIGTIQLLAGMPEGIASLERSLALSEQAGLEEHVGRAYIHVAWAMTRTRSYELASWFDRGVKACADLGLEGWRLYVLAYRARWHLDQGRWAEAAEDAAAVLRSAKSVPLLRILALSILGLIRARRGDPDQWSLLDEAFALLDGQDELQYFAPITTAWAEAAVLDGRAHLVEAKTQAGLRLASEREATWVVGELAWLRHLAGVTDTALDLVDPYAAQLAGDTGAAAKHWTQLGCPYDAAFALVESEEEGELRFALAEFQRLGARPAAGIVARRLREIGARGLPRGPRPRTKDSPALLTPRESEVLWHMRDGASNAEIAARLFLSERTVHHHVSAIFRKLGVTSRGRAVSEAARLGIGAPI
jgi:DNA-binding CsgD family transcriptional regulator/tetratricopeptide (TPR) repeat protein